MLDSLVKNLGKGDFKCWSQEFNSNKLNLVKRKWFYPNEYKSSFKKGHEKLPSKEKFYSSLIGKKSNDKDYEHALKIWNTFEIKAMKYYHDLYLNRGVLLLADVFENFRNSS